MGLRLELEFKNDFKNNKLPWYSEEKLDYQSMLIIKYENKTYNQSRIFLKNYF